MKLALLCRDVDECKRTQRVEFLISAIKLLHLNLEAVYV